MHDLRTNGRLRLKMLHLNGDKQAKRPSYKEAREDVSSFVLRPWHDSSFSCAEPQEDGTDEALEFEAVETPRPHLVKRFFHKTSLEILVEGAVLLPLGVAETFHDLR